ncbi:unnamed protein product [Gemmataceae bacterium]|nr:unnamed protein product [Gemmataceae bacterium]VTU01480.1 unnamed protein product [Gemmataceae bacterium]
MTTATLPLPVPAPAGTRLLGEVLAWACPGAAVTHAALVRALEDADLDPGVARELAPRHAFTRACKRLSDQRIIRPVSEDATTVKFQFTHESREGDHFEYTVETMLTLDKQTGAVTCELPGLATLAQEELDRCIAARTGGDVTRVVQKLFERQADLFPIRPQGGCYFCPAVHAGFTDKVQDLLDRVGGRLLRFPVPAGTPEGDRSVTRAVADGLAAVVAEHRAAVESFGADTRDDTLRRAAEKIRVTKFKVRAYAEYLSGERDRLDRAVAAAEAELRAKVEALAAVPA